MNKGLYSAVSAMLANLTRQNALTHNISNLETPGFKQVLISLEDFINTPVTHYLPHSGALQTLSAIANPPLGLGGVP